MFFNADLAKRNPFTDWPVPSLALAKGTWLGALNINLFFPPLIMMDKDCTVRSGFPKEVQKPMAELVDAFLYLGPPDLALTEKMRADIEQRAATRRAFLVGFRPARSLIVIVCLSLLGIGIYWLRRKKKKDK